MANYQANARIIYGLTGERRYIVDGVEVTEDEYNATVSPETLHDMFASQQAPQSNTSREFMAGRWTPFASDGLVDRVTRELAAKQGIRTEGKRYLHGLVRPGTRGVDPEAFVESQDDIRRVIEKRGWKCQGSVNMDATENVPHKEAKPVLVADTIVEERLAQHERTIGQKLQGKERLDAKEKIADKLMGARNRARKYKRAK